MSSHQIVHVEFTVSNPKEAGKFYADLFGWDVETTYEPSEYTMARMSSGPTAAYPEPVENFATGETLVYVSTDDVDATLKKAKSLGGTVMGDAFDIPTVGRMGIIGDPSGNKIAVIKFVEM